MALSSVFILLLIFVITAGILVRPFLEEPGRSAKDLSGDYDSLLAEKERILSAIEELDQAYELKKVSSRDYTFDRDALLHQAAEVFMQLDQLESKVGIGPPEANRFGS
jgi:hypothetical protein